MAIMIPEQPMEATAASKENEIFNALRNLPDEYYVFHSLQLTEVKNNILKEREGDFVIFSPNKGILCLEAKAGNIQLIARTWCYANGTPMSHGGPYHQAETFKYNLKDYIQTRFPKKDLCQRCKFLHAVCFPSIKQEYLEKLVMPSEAEAKLTLTQDSFDNITKAIEDIFSIDVNPSQIPGKEIKTKLTQEDTRFLIEKILAPKFNLFQASIGNKEIAFKRLLREQVALLNYLEEQDNAIINGLAGTGKTVLAIEKAKAHAVKGEKVLFLCFNKMLQEHLYKNYPHENIEYYTLAALACKTCDSDTADFEKLKDRLEEQFCEAKFEYKHVVIDEGQDFGNKKQQEIIQLLKDIVLSPEIGGTFYLFYDKNQMVQSFKLPKYIAEADCKLTLFRNCRNTADIAQTSLKLLDIKSEKQPKVLNDSVHGEKPVIIFADKAEVKSKVDSIIEEHLKNYGHTDNLTILTCKKEDESALSENCQIEEKTSRRYYVYEEHKVLFTTCRRFKGLESDVIILIDIDQDSFIKASTETKETNKFTSDINQSQMLMYVGSSRARYQLYCIANIDDEQCQTILKDSGLKFKQKTVYKDFAKCLNAKLAQ